jgi:hypothetical protein
MPDACNPIVGYGMPHNDETRKAMGYIFFVFFSFFLEGQVPLYTGHFTLDLPSDQIAYV